MRNIILLLLVVIIVSCNSTNEPIIGERIDGPANIRDTVNGKILFSLNDNTLIECTEPKNDWYIVGTEVLLSKEEESSFIIKKGSILKDKNETIIGEAFNDLSIGMSYETNGKNFGLIAGYTHKKNIAPASIPENILSKIVKDKGGNLTINDFNDFIKNFKFEKYDDKTEEYFIYENSLDDPSPRDRITLIFRNDQFIGIIHSRKLQLENFKTYELTRGHKFTPIAKLSKQEIQSITKVKTEFYNSID